MADAHAMVDADMTYHNTDDPPRNNNAGPLKSESPTDVGVMTIMFPPAVEPKNTVDAVDPLRYVNHVELRTICFSTPATGASSVNVAAAVAAKTDRP